MNKNVVRYINYKEIPLNIKYLLVRLIKTLNQLKRPLILKVD